MKRDFLLNLQVDGKPLPKEIIDAIMAENGRDIEGIKARYSDYDDIRQELTQTKTALEGTKSAEEWERRYRESTESYEKQLSDLRFGYSLDRAIEQAGGRNAKAIAALLDTNALRTEKDPAKLEQALKDLKKDCGYLFRQNQTPPPYAAGTGTQRAHTHEPATLAGALREKFERNG